MNEKECEEGLSEPSLHLHLEYTAPNDSNQQNINSFQHLPERSWCNLSASVFVTNFMGRLFVARLETLSSPETNCISDGFFLFKY